MNRIITYCLLISTVFFTSCSDFLEPKSQSEYRPQVIQSLDELLLGSAYLSPVEITSVFLYPVLGLFDDDVSTRPDMKEVRADDEKKWNKALLAYSWSKDMIHEFPGYNVYESAYKMIVGCNAVLDYIDEVTGTREEKYDVRLQALALRSFYYFHLVNLYGKPYSSNKNALGVPLKLTSRLSSEAIPRNTVGEVYDQIIGDLLEAEKLMKTMPQEIQRRKNKRVNLPFIQLLLSRVYLYMENWQQAMIYGEKVIYDYDYTLRDLNNMEDPDRWSSESYPNYFTWENPEMIFLLGDQRDATSLALLSVTVKWMQEGKEKSKIVTTCIASDELIKSYDPADLRKKQYLIWESLTKEETTPVYKIPTSKLKVGTNYSLSSGWGKAWGIAFKVTEAYLNTAEAAAMLYKTKGGGEYKTKTLQLMDNLRYKRYEQGKYHPLDISNPEDLVAFVRAERRRELCFEHHRWFDLRRYGMEEIRHIWYDKDHRPVEYVLKKNDPGFTLLIPKGAFERNPKLIQNEERPNN
ncbi:RagB/SusD family nutrient uptake outer membrane protein [Sanguibacteroides justesenii]|uniref:Glycan metabolism protein n=1 Tax=Sanguibacteroides justesenii TaxID=1547597 RepID=A0AB34QZS3_9PORP|nr:RagB/SusD family nutrient uptake outer membrane protein [Sanguibacteroides justesenii]KIO42518.1 glycan metabolism protein [Sanguibacteroides justesenii]PXZ42991.1 RagB/SusD family nutrient uptake outer membrane protein [Sanguibacteroides justesenii]